MTTTAISETNDTSEFSSQAPDSNYICCHLKEESLKPAEHFANVANVSSTPHSTFLNLSLIADSKKHKKYAMVILKMVWLFFTFSWKKICRIDALTSQHLVFPKLSLLKLLMNETKVKLLSSLIWDDTLLSDKEQKSGF